jgi:tape measure domain-containing protein
MASVDNTVVSMTFDNKKFESNVANTMGSLGRLTDSISTVGQNTGLSGLQKASDSFNMTGMSDAVSGVSAKFLALSTIGITALANLTSRAVDSGMAIARSLVVAPISDGFAEYELKMGSIQTIMAGTGEELSVVNGYLNDLNDYSDRTIYSFADMTSNIGKFTNAGVGLDSAVKSIQGIANVAALSGANSQQASNAMYNFSQALATGSVKLIDWKSIENAGLATVGFKENLLEGAVAAGSLTKSTDGLYKTLDGVPVDSMKNFNTTLQEGWLNADTLTGTLQLYSDDTTDIGKAARDAAQDVKTFSQAVDTIKESVASGWAASAEIFFGDFEEGKALWTQFEAGVSGIAGASADARNAVLQDWKDLGGRALLLEGLKDAVSGFATILKPIGDAFREIFPRKTGKDLLSMTEAFASFAKRIAITGGTADKVKSIFKGVFAVFSIGFSIIKGIAKLFTNLFGLFTSGTSGGILSFFAKIGDGIVYLKEALVDGGGIDDLVNRITGSLSGFVDYIKALNITPIIDWFKELKTTISDFISSIDLTPAINWFKELKTSISDFVSGIDLEPTMEALGRFKETLFGLFTSGASAGKDGIAAGAKGSFEGLKAIFEALIDVAKTFGDILGKIGSVFGSIGRFVKSVISGIKDALSGVGGGLGDAFSSNNFDKVLTAMKTGLFAGLLLLIKKFLTDGFSLFTGGNFMKEATEALEGVTGVLKGMEMSLKAEALMKIAIALGVLALSILLLSTIDPEQIAISLGALTVGIGQLLTAMALLNKIDISPRKFIGIAVGLTILSAALFMFAIALKLMSTMDLDEMGVGLAGVTGLLLGMGVAVKLMSDNQKGMIQLGIGIGFIAAAMILLALSVKLMSMIAWQDTALGMGTLGLALYGLTKILNRIDKDGVLKAAFAIGVLSGSLLILALAIKTMSLMGWEEISRGLFGVAGGLGLLVLAFKGLPAKDAEKVGISLFLVAMALRTIAGAVEIMANIGFIKMMQGIGGLALILAGLVFALKGFEASATGAVVILAVAAALYLLATVFEQFANISYKDIIKGLVALIGVLAILTIAGYAIGPVAVVFVALGASMLMFGAGVALAGIGILSFAKSLQIVAKFGGAAVDTFMMFLDKLMEKLPKLAATAGASLGEFLKSFVTSFPEILKILGGLVIQLLDILIEAIPKAVEVVKLLIAGIIDTIKENVDGYVEAGYAILTALLNGLRDNIGEIVTTVADIIVNFLDALALKLPEIIDSVVNFMDAVIVGVLNAYVDIAKRLLPIGEDLLDGVLQGVETGAKAVWEWFKDLPNMVLEMIGDVGIWLKDTGIGFIAGLYLGFIEKSIEVMLWVSKIPLELIKLLADAATTLIPTGIKFIAGLYVGFVRKGWDVMRWMMDLPFKIIGWIGKAAKWLIPTGYNFMVGLYNGIINFVNETFIPWTSNLPSKIIGWVGSLLETMVQAGKDLIQGLINGMGSMGQALANKAKSMAESVLGAFTGFFDMRSPSKVMQQQGKYLMQGLGVGIEKNAKISENEITAMSTNLKTALEKSVNEMNKVGSELNDDFNPSITPVLDLSSVRRDAKQFGELLSSNVGVLSTYNQANLISQSHEANRTSEDSRPETQTPTEITFNQTNNSPQALSTNDIYRASRSQFALAKDELGIK